MAIEKNIKQVPDVAWEYWGWYETMQDVGTLYGLNDRRIECHERLCKHYKLPHEETKEVTDNLDRYENACQMHDALIEVQKKSNAGVKPRRGSDVGSNPLLGNEN